MSHVLRCGKRGGIKSDKLQWPCVESLDEFIYFEKEHVVARSEAVGRGDFDNPAMNRTDEPHGSQPPPESLCLRTCARDEGGTLPGSEHNCRALNGAV
jgi:hypothetical protein